MGLSRPGSRSRRSGWCGLVREPDHSLHVVDKVGETDLGCRSGQADRANERAHWPFLSGEDVLDYRAHRRLAGIGVRGAARHRLAFGFLSMDLRTQSTVGEVLLVCLRAISGIGPDITGGVVLIDELRQYRAIVTSRIGDGAAADQAVPAVDANVILVPESRDREIDAAHAFLARLGLGIFTVQRASRLAGFVVHPGGMRPCLISRFSPSVLRCFGAATIEASMIWPLIAKKPAFASATSGRANSTSIAGLPGLTLVSWRDESLGSGQHDVKPESLIPSSHLSTKPG